MANPFVHVELNTSDIEKAKAFYSGLFDWKLEDVSMPGGVYTLINVGSGTGGGMMSRLPPETSSHWMPYVSVEDIDASTAKAKSLGATIMIDVHDIGPGWFSIIVDPTGAMIGLWKPRYS